MDAVEIVCSYLYEVLCRPGRYVPVHKEPFKQIEKDVGRRWRKRTRLHLAVAAY
jgi:hypothetical protein